MQFFRKFIFGQLLVSILFSVTALGEIKELKIRLTSLVNGFSQPTDIQFFPKNSEQFLLLEKEGSLKQVAISTKKIKEIHRFKVHKHSELGLLGLAFHPNFQSNKKIYINYNPSSAPKLITRISEFQFLPSGKLSHEKILLEIAQPYSNHNAGQLAFGPDGFLYIGLGDGGSAGDPLQHGQNLKTLLGSMLRIDVDHSTNSMPYGIPKDNPYKENKSSFRPEIWANGLRNPWRFSFDPKGRLIVADVGQNEWEEISIIKKGGNYGWRIWEGKHCYSPKKNCKEKLANPHTPPIWEYSHQEGQSITGGYTYFASDIKELNNHYIFGDFVTGKLWALPVERPTQVVSLGKWRKNFSTFGRDSKGRVYVADFGSGTVFRIDPSN